MHGIFPEMCPIILLNYRINDIEYFAGDKDLPVWMNEAKSLSSHDIVRTVLFEKDTVKPYVCKKQPLSINENATFIVDLSQLPSKKDITADDMGVWKHNGSPSQYYEVRKNQHGGLQEIVSLGKKRPKQMVDGIYRIKKNYSCHHSSSDLLRTIIFIEGKVHVLRTVQSG